MRRLAAAALLVTSGVLARSRGREPARAVTAASSRAPAPVRHAFEVLSSALADPASPDAGDDVTCLYGRHPANARVLLLSERDAFTCPVQTASTGVHAMTGGACTLLAGIDACDFGAHRYSLGVIGSRGEYRPMEATMVLAGPALEHLKQVVAREKAVAAATARWKDALAREREHQGAQGFGADVTEVVSWPELEGAPALAHLKVEGQEGGGGPWVAVSGGKVVGLVGPFSAPRPPSAFVLDGRAYVRFEAAGCTGCGWVWTELHAVERGALRLVLESGPDAN